MGATDVPKIRLNGNQADVLDLEPVIPLNVTSDWNIITRTMSAFAG
jgi:hypothetical protein